MSLVWSFFPPDDVPLWTLLSRSTVMKPSDVFMVLICMALRLLLDTQTGFLRGLAYPGLPAQLRTCKMRISGITATGSKRVQTKGVFEISPNPGTRWFIKENTSSIESEYVFAVIYRFMKAFWPEVATFVEPQKSDCIITVTHINPKMVNIHFLLKPKWNTVTLMVFSGFNLEKSLNVIWRRELPVWILACCCI